MTDRLPRVTPARLMSERIHGTVINNVSSSSAASSKLSTCNTHYRYCTHNINKCLSVPRLNKMFINNQKHPKGTGIRGQMRSMANLPQGNQELLVVKDKVSKSIGCDIFPSVPWHCWLGDRKGIRPVKRLGVGLLVVMIWVELCMTYSSSCHHHLHHRLLQ